jgi:hypothetical protein
MPLDYRLAAALTRCGEKLREEYAPEQHGRR